MKCRSCNGVDALPVLDFGSLPPANSYPEKGTDPKTEPRYPLRVFVCQSCWLMQTEDKVDKKLLFNDSYAYHSSHSSSLLKHSSDYASKMIKGLGLTSDDMVVEVASNDGYLLQYFDMEGIRTLGIEPTEASADLARTKGLETIGEFFGLTLAAELKSGGIRPRLMIGNNVLAHVPDIHDFVGGFAEMLHPKGVATFEFPHVMNLLKNGLYDTIYHEHFSYLSAKNAVDTFAESRMKVIKIEKIPTHGGSLRIYVSHMESPMEVDESVFQCLAEESRFGLQEEQVYKALQSQAQQNGATLREYLETHSREKKTIYGFGAAAKASTLLNFSQVDTSLIEQIFDTNPVKIGKQIPGTGIVIAEKEKMNIAKPSRLMIFTWNLIPEIVSEIRNVNEWEPELVIPNIFQEETLSKFRKKLSYQKIVSIGKI